MNFRLFAAVLIAKTALFMSRFTGRGRGSSLPGMLALKVLPDILKYYAGQPGSGMVMVTGTNGKTTTNNMLVKIIEGAGFKVVANREGANLITGVVTAFIKSSSLTGRLKCDYAILEVDEAAFPVVIKYLKPDIVVITNFFRDQLDRYGELDTTVSKVLEALKKLPDSTVLVLNSDDPLVARFATDVGYTSIFYGLRPEFGLSGKETYSRESKFCPYCGEALTYQIYFYSQLGQYGCSSCGFKRPQPDLEAAEVKTGSSHLEARIIYNDTPWPMSLSVTGLHNLYNAMGAFAVASQLGVNAETALACLQNYIPAIGRAETFIYNNKRVVLTLVKNPTGFNQALNGLLSGEVEQDVMIAINDNDADGRDISWLWDVDFEVLAGPAAINIRLICAGQRAEDMALRLKYAGLPIDQIKIEKDFAKAIDITLHGSYAAANIMATYTALWPVEKILSQRAERVLHGANLSGTSIS